MAQTQSNQANKPASTDTSFAHLRSHRREKLQKCVQRLALSKGVFGVMVTTETWTIIESTFEPSLARYWKKQVKAVEELGVAVIRDSDPRNDLQFLRVQTSKYEMLLSIAEDHRVLVVFSSTMKNPFEGIDKVLKARKRKLLETRKGRHGNRVRSGMDPCAPHTKRVGGMDKVIITEKIDGKIIDQKDDVNLI